MHSNVTSTSLISELTAWMERGRGVNGLEGGGSSGNQRPNEDVAVHLRTLWLSERVSSREDFDCAWKSDRMWWKSRVFFDLWPWKSFEPLTNTKDENNVRLWYGMLLTLRSFWTCFRNKWHSHHDLLLFETCLPCLRPAALAPLPHTLWLAAPPTPESEMEGNPKWAASWLMPPLGKKIEVQREEGGNYRPSRLQWQCWDGGKVSL